MKTTALLPSPAHGRGVGGEGIRPGGPYFQSRGGRGVRAARLPSLVSRPTAPTRPPTCARPSTTLNPTQPYHPSPAPRPQDRHMTTTSAPHLTPATSERAGHHAARFRSPLSGPRLSCGHHTISSRFLAHAAHATAVTYPAAIDAKGYEAGTGGRHGQSSPTKAPCFVPSTETRLDSVHFPWCDKCRGAAWPGSTDELKCPSCKLVFRRTLPLRAERGAEGPGDDPWDALEKALLVVS